MENYEQLNKLLKTLRVGYLHYTHPPLETCEDADKYFIQRPGQRLKNLFLRDNYGRRHFLLLTAHNKQVDLKQLSKQQAISRFGFASNERLLKYLSVKPGCISALALMNDIDKKVELLIDEDIWNSDAFHCHPLINTETYVIKKSDLLRFLKQTGHSPNVITVPNLEACKVE